MRIFILIISLLCFGNVIAQPSLTGAWERWDGTSTESRIYAGNHFAVSFYDVDGKQFLGRSAESTP